MVEVFKTNVESDVRARQIIDHIRGVYPDYSVNFDLEDCDHILRIECCETGLDVAGICTLLTAHGVQAEVLPDSLPAPQT